MGTAHIQRGAATTHLVSTISRTHTTQNSTILKLYVTKTSRLENSTIPKLHHPQIPGRIARFELIPLEELGRPRVDVLCNMSGIFRDAFQNVVELLDDMFQRAAAANEDAELNFIRKHALVMQQQGLDNGAARLFSNPAGDFGSFVNEQVGLPVVEA